MPSNATPVRCRTALACILVSLCLPAGSQAARPNAPILAQDCPYPLVTWVPTASAAKGVSVAVFSPSRPRYPAGAPVVVVATPPERRDVRAPREDALGLTSLGFVVVTFAYPGKAGGADDGGPICKRALADVIQFALGAKPDQGLLPISQRASAPILPGLVGVIGLQQGGNTVMCTLEDYAEELSGVAFCVLCEAPCGTSPSGLGDCILADYGRTVDGQGNRADSDGNGLPWDDYRSPFYAPDAGLEPPALAWDLAGVNVDHGEQHEIGALFTDGNRNGMLDSIVWLGPPTFGPEGKRITPLMCSYDTNKNGRADRSEDYAFSFAQSADSNTVTRYYSLPVSRAFAAAGLLGVTGIAIASPQQAEAYWAERDMAADFPDLSPWLTSMLTIICAGRADHRQAQPDYPHIRAQYDGLRSVGMQWVKIGPDRAYVHALLGATPLEFPEQVPNTPVTAQTVFELTSPTRGRLTEALTGAAAAELADRVISGEREGNLDHTIFPLDPPVAAVVPDELWVREQLIVPPNTTGVE